MTNTRIQPDDLFHLVCLQSAQLSPDGRSVVYSLLRVEAAGTAAEQECAILWLLSLESGQERRLTFGRWRDTDPCWSPDGAHIAFLSDRGGTAQIYVMPVDGGEARALTSLPRGIAGGPTWSPDGALVAFSAGPQSKPPDSAKPYRLTRRVIRYDGLGYLDRVVNNLYVVPAEGGESRQLTDDRFHNTAPRWSPDGREIIYSASMNPDSPFPEYAVLRAVGLEGERRDITGEWGTVLAAAWLPDGQRIAFIGAPRERVGDTRYDLYSVDRAGGDRQCHTANLPGGVGGSVASDLPSLLRARHEPVILPLSDGSGVLVQVQAGSAMRVHRVALAGGASSEPVLQGARACVLLGGDDRQILFGAGDAHNSADLCVAGLDGAGERRLTQLNEGLLSQRARPGLERLEFTAPDGVPVEGWVMPPPGGQPPYPTVLYIHGGPYNTYGHNFMFDFHMLAGAGYAVLFINYRGSSGYGTQFATQIFPDLGQLEYADLMAGVDAAVARGLADPDRLGCCGPSYGGFLTNWIVGHTRRFKAAVSEASVSNQASLYGSSDIPGWQAQAFGGAPHEAPELYARASPITYAPNCTTPTLLVVGENDYRCPAEQTEQFYAALKAAGCVVEMLRFPGSSHGGPRTGPLPVRRAQNEALLDWFNRHLR